MNIGEPLKWMHDNPQRVHSTAVLFAKNYADCRSIQYLALACLFALDAAGSTTIYKFKFMQKLTNRREVALLRLFALDVAVQRIYKLNSVNGANL